MKLVRTSKKVVIEGVKGTQLVRVAARYGHHISILNENWIAFWDSVHRCWQPPIAVLYTSEFQLQRVVGVASEDDIQREGVNLSSCPQLPV